MKKLIVSDIDGTLIHQGNPVSQKNIDAIKELKRQGHYFTIASGRSTVLMANYFNDLNKKNSWLVVAPLSMVADLSGKPLSLFVLMLFSLYQPPDSN